MLYKRKDSPFWWIKVTVKGFRTVYESTGTAERPLAQEYHDRRKADLWRQSRLKERPRYTWDEAVLRYLEETSSKRDHNGDKARLRWVHPKLTGHYLDSIDRAYIQEIMAPKLERAAGTYNRYVATIRAILRKAVVWTWIDNAPALFTREEPKGRVKWFTHEQSERLLVALPEHWRDMADFTLATGLRASNARELTWAQVDTGRRMAWVYGDQAKGKRDIPIPLNERAMAALKRRKDKDSAYVFGLNGKPYSGIDNQTWKRACEKANLKGFRWHDLRHTWASWHVMSGTDLRTLMELGGWSTWEMVLRYAHLAAPHLQKAAKNLDRMVTNQLRSNVVPIEGRKRKAS